MVQLRLLMHVLEGDTTKGWYYWYGGRFRKKMISAKEQT